MRTRLLVSVLLVLVPMVQGPLNAGEAAGTAGEILELSGAKAGLCVHLECSDGRLVTEIARTGRFLVHGLTSDAATLDAIRKRFAEEGIGGVAGVEALPLKRLPYADNLVNLLVAEDLPGLVEKGLGPEEILRVLCPNGTACLGVTTDKQKEMEARLARAGIRNLRSERKSLLWLVFSKPRPEGMDDWTHWNHAPDGNHVSQDMLIERPNQIQWINGQHWRSDRIAGAPGSGSPRGVRCAKGRNYYVMGGGPFAGSGHGLVARDAFNGVMLWYQDISGLNHRLLVASDDEVYVYREGELVALDGATGKTARSYGRPVGCRHIILADGLLLSFEARTLRALEAATGKEKWSSTEGAAAGSPVVSGGNLFFMRGGPVCMDLASGKVKWKKEGDGEIVFAFNDMLLLRSDAKGTLTKGGLRYTALSAKDGAEIWSYACDRPVGRYPEVYFASGLVWIQGYDEREKRKTEGFHNPKGGESYKWDGLDPKSGNVSRSFLAPVMLSYACHLRYATERFQIGIRPLYFTDWKTGEIARFEATRGACSIGYGLGCGMFYGIYTDSPMCNCIRQAISGVTAFASDGKTIDGEVKVEKEDRLQKGPALPPESAPAPQDDDWPMYRHDMRRSASVNGRISGEQLRLVWKKELLPSLKSRSRNLPSANNSDVLRNDWLLNKVSGDPATQATIAEGRVFVSLTHAQQVVALEEKSGDTAWTFYTPCRVEAPPTIHQGLCLFGCNDGWVYCLRTDNGKLVWRFRVAPAERRIVAYGQVESAWPVMGGVLAVDNVAYVVAGRTTETDGGLYVHALEVKTGKPLWSERRAKPDDGPIGAWNLRGHNSDYFGPADILCSDGKTVAIAGHSHGRFNCKTGSNVGDWSFDIHLGLMQSQYSWDNQKTRFPPLAYSDGMNVAPRRIQDKQTKKDSYYVAMSGKARWNTQLPEASMRIEALVLAGDTASERSHRQPGVRVASTRRAPKIDGRIDDLYTKNATGLSFSHLDGTSGKPKESTTAYLLCDEENLYMAFRCEKADPDSVVCKKTKRDDNIWQDEAVEIFLDPENTREKKYFHIIVNPAGVTQDARLSDASWNPALTVKCGKEKGKAWTAEIQIPFNELALKGEKVGNIWSINLNRSARDPKDPERCEDTAWSPTNSDSSHVPAMFGYMWLDALPGGRDEAAFAEWRKKVGPPAAPAEAVAKPTASDGGMVLATISSKEQNGTNGELWLLSARDGSILARHTLPAAPAFEGLAVANGEVYVTLQDGTVMCLSAK